MVYLNIEELLKKKKKTKYWLVNKMESDYQTINAMINNETKGIKFATIEKLCTILECTPNELIIIKKKK